MIWIAIILLLTISHIIVYMIGKQNGYLEGTAYGAREFIDEKLQEISHLRECLEQVKREAMNIIRAAHGEKPSAKEKK